MRPIRHGAEHTIYMTHTETVLFATENAEPTHIYTIHTKLVQKTSKLQNNFKKCFGPLTGLKCMLIILWQ